MQQKVAKSCAQIAAQIDEGYAAAQRGALIDADAVRAQMDERKRDWQAEHHLE